MVMTGLKINTKIHINAHGVSISLDNQVKYIPMGAI